MTKQEFDRFVSENGKDILRFCRMNTGGTAEGDDLYQDTMLKLWEQADQLNKNDSLKSYALSVSILMWKNKRRKFAWRRRIAAFESYEKHMEDAGDRMAGRPADNPEETFLQKEMTELVQRQGHCRINTVPSSTCIILQGLRYGRSRTVCRFRKTQ